MYYALRELRCERLQCTACALLVSNAAEFVKRSVARGAVGYRKRETR